MRELLINEEDSKELFYESGRRGYFVGSLDGTIPPVGYHIEKKMCGLWFPPHRILGALEWFGANGETLRFLRFETLSVGRRIVLKDSDSTTTLTFLMSEDSPDFRVEVATSKPLLCRIGLDATRIWDKELTTSDTFSLPYFLKAFPGKFELEVEGRTYVVSFPGARLVKREGSKILWRVSRRGELRLSRLGVYPKRFQKLMEDKEKARHARNVESSPIRYWTKNMLLDFIAETGNGKGVIAGFPEYPWWFGIDTYFIGLALLELDLPKLAVESFQNMVSRLADGAVPHEVNLDGKVIFPGKALETLLQADLLLKLTEVVLSPKEAEELFYLLHNAGKAILKVSPYPKGPGFVELQSLETPNIQTLDNAVAAFVFVKSMCRLSKRLGIDSLKGEYETLSRWYDTHFLRDWYDPGRGIFKGAICCDKEAGGITFAQIFPLVYGLVNEDIARTHWKSLQQLGLITPSGLIHSLGFETDRGYYGKKDEKVWWLGNALLKKAAKRYDLTLPNDLDSLFEEDLFRKGMPGAIPEIVGLEGGCFAQAWSALYVARW
ncbi:MAG: hypothetical protein J7J80_03825 [Thermotogae bacterium]|nr:hypothetical protein [Thermotogota bacterium]